MLKLMSHDTPNIVAGNHVAQVMSASLGGRPHSFQSILARLCNMTRLLSLINFNFYKQLEK